MNLTPETAICAALKQAVQSLSKKKQTVMITEYIYSRFEVFRQFRPLTVGIHAHLIEALPQFDANLIARVVANHCRRPRYIKALARGGKRFDLAGRVLGEVTLEEKKAAQLASHQAPPAIIDSDCAVAK